MPLRVISVRRLLEYALSHATMPVYIRSDALGEEVDAQVGAFQDDKNLYLMLEYVIGGEFFSHLRKAGRFPNDTSKFYASQITLVFEYLDQDLKKFRGVEVIQGVQDLKTCKEDIDRITATLARYGVTDMGKDGIYRLDDSPCYKRVNAVRMNITARVKKSPDLKFLIVFAIAGHGMSVDGRQVVLINEFSPKTGFYKYWGVESEIRSNTKDYPNSYQIRLFACCRKIFRT